MYDHAIRNEKRNFDVVYEWQFSVIRSELTMEKENGVNNPLEEALLYHFTCFFKNDYPVKKQTLRDDTIGRRYVPLSP